MQNIIIRKMVTKLFCVVLTVLSMAATAVEFDQASVTVNEIKLDVEYAKSFEQRATGLMHRESLCGDCGMLFEYSRPLKASMWMKNTLIPLDIAFIDKNGIITDIKTMQPHDLTSIGSSGKVLYALEMNAGWYAKHNIKVGQTIGINTH